MGPTCASADDYRGASITTQLVNTAASVVLPPRADGAASPQRRIAVIAPSRSPVAQPFAGGLEAHVWSLTCALRARGHDVTLFAAPGTDPALGATELSLHAGWLSLEARRDVSMQPDVVVVEHHAYLELMVELSRSTDHDVVHNHSLHYLPMAMAAAVPAPMMTTLHTPPTPWLESAARVDPRRRRHLVAVSRYTARSWQHIDPDIEVVLNGVDTTQWRFGAGGPQAVWTGRIAPEKGLHLAIEAAALAGVTLDIAGPLVDPRYFADRIRPQLGSRARYLGHLRQDALSELVREACVAVVTPDWDEPYGLVVAEALASGTPVAAFARGGIPEIVNESVARLAPAGDVVALAGAIAQARELDRASARAHAIDCCSVDAMIEGYERVMTTVTSGHRS